MKKKNMWKQSETVSSLGTGKQFYIFVKVGYYPSLSLAVLTFILFNVYCHVLYCLLGIPMFNQMAYSAIAWPNVPCTKLSHCLLIVDMW